MKFDLDYLQDDKTVLDQPKDHTNLYVSILILYGIVWIFAFLYIINNY